MCKGSPLILTKTIKFTCFVYSNISLFFKNFPINLWLFLNMEKFWEDVCSFRLNFLRFRRIALPFWYIIYLTGLRMPKSERRYVTSMFAWMSNMTTHKSFKIYCLKFFHSYCNNKILLCVKYFGDISNVVVCSFVM